MVGLRKTFGSLNHQGERGQSLVMFVLALGVLLGMVAMTVDVGVILHERRALQNAADAAALAAAVELPDSAPLAEANALEWATRNGVGLDAGDELDITVSPDQTSITVEVRRETSFIFGRVLGLDTADVHASATARIGAPASLSGVLPFGVLESEINYDGTPTVIKFDAKGGSNGNRGVLRIDGNGANVYRDSVKYGTQNKVCAVSQPSCVDPTVPTEPGNMIGPTRDGLEYRFGNTSSSCDEFDEVLVSKGNGKYYISRSCNPFSGSSGSGRLVLIPVINEFPNGSNPVTLQYFTVMFLNDFDPSTCKGNNCEVTGTFVMTVGDPTSAAELGIYDEQSAVAFVRLVK